MENSQQLRHPSQVLKEIRAQYQRRENITTEAAQAWLSKICGWPESKWSNLERATAHTGQKWNSEYASILVSKGLIKQGDKFHKELTLWEQVEEAALDQSDRQRLLSLYESEPSVGKEADISDTRSVKESDDVHDDLARRPEDELAKTAEDAQALQEWILDRRAKRIRSYWMAGLAGSLVLLLLCGGLVLVGYYFMQTAWRNQPTHSGFIERTEEQAPVVIPVERATENGSLTVRPRPAEPSPLAACPASSEASSLAGVHMVAIGEFCGFHYRGPLTEATCPEDWICVWYYADPDIKVYTGPASDTILAGTWRLPQAYPTNDEVRNPCTFVEKVRLYAGGVHVEPGNFTCP